MTTSTPSAGPLLRWTRFTSDPHGTGPEKRSAQIRALCLEAGFTLSDMKPPAAVPFWKTYPAGLAARWEFGTHAALYGRNLGLLGFHAQFYREALARHQGAKVLLWETTYDTNAPRAGAAGWLPRDRPSAQS